MAHYLLTAVTEAPSAVQLLSMTHESILYLHSPTPTHGLVRKFFRKASLYNKHIHVDIQLYIIHYTPIAQPSVCPTDKLSHNLVPLPQ